MTLRRPITFACASSSKPGWTLTKNSKNCCKRDCLTRAIFQKWPRVEMLANKRFLDWSGKGDAVMPLGKKKNEKKTKDRALTHPQGWQGTNDEGTDLDLSLLIRDRMDRETI